MTNSLYEVAYRDSKRICVAHTLAISAADAMAQFLAPVRATLIGDHNIGCDCHDCNDR